MCDHMYYEHRQKGKLKNLIPAEEPELESVTTTAAVEEEKQPMTVSA